MIIIVAVIAIEGADVRCVEVVDELRVGGEEHAVVAGVHGGLAAVVGRSRALARSVAAGAHEPGPRGPCPDSAAHGPHTPAVRVGEEQREDE